MGGAPNAAPWSYYEGLTSFPTPNTFKNALWSFGQPPNSRTLSSNTAPQWAVRQSFRKSELCQDGTVIRERLNANVNTENKCKTSSELQGQVGCKNPPAPSPKRSKTNIITEKVCQDGTGKYKQSEVIVTT